MVLKAKGTITGDVKGTRLRIYIPSILALDSAFPLKKGDVIVIEIDKENRRVIVEKHEKRRSRSIVST